MSNTLVGYFDDYEDARRTELELVAAGFRHENVDVVSRNVGEWSAPVQARETWWDRFRQRLGLATNEERTLYETAAVRGGALVVVRATDEQTNAAAEILERHHPRSLDPSLDPAGTGASVRVPRGELPAGPRVVQWGPIRIHTQVEGESVEPTIEWPEG